MIATMPPGLGSPGMGDDAAAAAGHASDKLNQHTARRNPLMRLQMYEITFAGQAGSTLRAEFDECEVAVGPDTTTLRAELPDQAALSGPPCSGGSSSGGTRRCAGTRGD